MLHACFAERRRAFSLIEVLVAAALGFVVLLLLGYLAARILAIMSLTQRQGSLQHEAFVAWKSIDSDLRRSSKAALTVADPLLHGGDQILLLRTIDAASIQGAPLYEPGLAVYLHRNSSSELSRKIIAVPLVGKPSRILEANIDAIVGSASSNQRLLTPHLTSISFVAQDGGLQVALKLSAPAEGGSPATSFEISHFTLVKNP